MNFLQRNPNDPQYEEFHHGEYEYWPVDGGLKSKSISFPAALVSGLELLAAVAGAGLLAAALTVMYVLSAPLSIHEHTATINANVYNNLDDLSISYVLSSGLSIVQEGTLDGDEDTLNLQGLNSGTTYLLKYYDADQKEIGKFQFTTPGEQEIPEDPNPDNDLQQPVDPKPDDNRDPVVNPETDKEPEAGTEATESTEATTVPTEVPIRPGYRPPVVIPAKPEPTPESKPDPKPEQKPEQKPEVPPVPTPAPGAPEISGFKNEQFISGVLEYGDLAYTEHFVFLNVPENYDFGVDWSSTNAGRECIYTHTYQNGTLTISVTGAVIFGHRIETTVTVYTSYGEISKTSILSPPELATATLSVVPVENTSNTFTFHVTATTSMEDDSAVTEGMVLTAELFPYLTANSVQFPMTQDPNNPSHYSGTYTADIPASATKMAVVSVSGYWERNAENIFLQTKNAENTYS